MLRALYSVNEVIGLGTLAGILSPTRRPFSYVVKGDDLEEYGLAEFSLRVKWGIYFFQ